MSETTPSLTSSLNDWSFLGVITGRHLLRVIVHQYYTLCQGKRGREGEKENRKVVRMLE